MRELSITEIDQASGVVGLGVGDSAYSVDYLIGLTVKGVTPVTINGVWGDFGDIGSMGQMSIGISSPVGTWPNDS